MDDNNNPTGTPGAPTPGGDQGGVGTPTPGVPTPGGDTGVGTPTPGAPTPDGDPNNPGGATQ